MVNVVLDISDGAVQGYWCMFPAACLFGKFVCLHPSHDQGHEWTSRQIHVDIKVKRFYYCNQPTVDQFRYNFEEQRGEVKVAKEWRQRCSSNQERENHGWVLPLLEDGQAVWMTRKLVSWIRKEFYEPPVAFQPGYAGPRWMPESPDHHRSDCEACLQRRCPDLTKYITEIHKYHRNTQISSLKVPSGEERPQEGRGG